MNKKKIIITILITTIIFGILLFWLLPTNYEKECKEREYKELKKIAEKSKNSVIGIVPEEEVNGLTNHNGIGSGVIFSKKDNTYYVITAAHVVENTDIKYKIFTINTKFSGKTIKASEDVNFEIPDENYYASLLYGKIEYISNNTDLAIISFESKEDLPIMEFETNIDINDKIIAIGHPEGNKYTITYGKIISNKKKRTISSKTTSKRKTDTIIEHNAYLNFGNSGGVVITKNMKIAGINIGGSFTLLGFFKEGLMIPYDIVEKNINKWNKNKDKPLSINSWTKDKVTIKVSNKTKKKTNASITIEDRNDTPTSWGEEFSIQKMSEGDNKWYDLISNSRINWLKQISSPNEKGITKVEIDWSNIYGPLSSGTYRIVKRNGFISIYSEPFKI